MKSYSAALTLIAVLAIWFGASAISAQNLNGADQFTVPISSPILTVEPERLFSASLFGQRVAKELQEEREALVSDKAVIEAQLEVEEQELTEQRNTLPPLEFTKLANTFDAKVQQLRRDQLERSRVFTAKSERAQQEFFTFALPVLADIVRTSGAVAILERRTVFLASDSIDITDLAIDRINAELGDGRTSEDPQ